MSIIMIADDFPPAVGGIQTYSLELARATAELGEEVAVVASAQRGAEEVDAELPCSVVRVPTGGSYVLAATNLATGVRLAAQGLSRPPRCLVATKWSPEGPAAILAVRALGCPIVLLGHGGEFAASGGNVVKWLVQRAVLRRAARCLANSEHTAGIFHRARVRPERIGIIYGGVRPERFERPPEQVVALRAELGLGERPVLLTVARLVERKGHETVLRALPTVLAHVPDLRYLIVGEGPMREPLEALVQELGIGDAVIFTGEVSPEKLPLCYLCADVFTMPSHAVPGELAEGLGLAFLEAAAAGVPSVATRFGGIPDAIADAETGLLVAPREDAALAEALARLLTDAQMRARMGAAARERVQRQFTWRHVAERFLAQLEMVAPTGPAGAAP
ncbi:MAG: glycosyltransferase family 4 protein [Armatimonadota bacterium]